MPVSPGTTGGRGLGRGAAGRNCPLCPDMVGSLERCTPCVEERGMWRAMFCVCPGSQRFSLPGLLVLGILVLIVMPRGELMAQPQAPVRAPGFPEGMQWLNTDRPLRLAD